MKKSKFVIIEAPSILGLKPSGVQDLPEALKRAGLVEGLNAEFVEKVIPPPYNPERDPTTMLLNPLLIKNYSIQLADVISREIKNDQFPVVLGGDCSILIGCMLALRRSGKYGLFFIDGHADFYQPEAEPNGETASMELAIVSGRGPDVLTDIDGLKPLINDKHIVAFGFRDSEEQMKYGSQDIHNTFINIFELRQIRNADIAETTNIAISKLQQSEIKGFWVHLDADVLDSKLMPAVDYLLPDGLQWEELTNVLKIIMKSGQAVGLSITIFNPRLDPDGSIASILTKIIIDGLT